MQKKLEKLIREPRTIAAALLLFLVAIAGVLLINKIFNESEDAIAPGQIQIKRGDKVVTVNENGLVEYKSDKGVFYETWTPSRTDAFFATMRAKARKYLANPPDVIPPNAYEVTLWIDGEIVVIYISGDDEDLSEVLEEIFEEFEDSGDGDLGDFFDEEEEDGGITPTLTVFSPTPTLPPGVTATPTPIGGSGGGGGTVQSVPDCDLYGSLVTQRTIISNTNCQIDQE